MANAPLVSRNGNDFHKFDALASFLPKELNADAAVLDGEVVCLDSQRRSQFNELLFKRGETAFLKTFVFGKSTRGMGPKRVMYLWELRLLPSKSLTSHLRVLIAAGPG